MPEAEPIADLFGQFGDIFGDLFGVGGKRRPDLRMTITVDLAEIDAGTKRTIDVDRFVVCEGCAGRGAPPDVDSTSCDACDGRGAHQQRSGLFAIQTTCKECQGKGEIFEELCVECSGEGGRARLESLTVAIPPGVAEGQTLRLKGKGNDLGEGPGDLYCAIHMSADRRFSREGDDLHACVELTDVREERVTSVELPFGTVEVRVPAGATSGDRIQLRGHGITKLGSLPMPRPTGDQDPYRSIEASEHRGDLIVHLVEPGQASPFSDHAILGVAPDATQPQIKAAFRRLAMELHPDRNPDDADTAARFAKVSDAFSRLSMPQPADLKPQSARAPSTWMWVGLLLVAAAVMFAMMK